MDKRHARNDRSKQAKEFKPKSIQSGDTVSWLADPETYKVLEITDKADCGIKVLKIKGLSSGTEFFVHEDALSRRRYNSEAR